MKSEKNIMWIIVLFMIMVSCCTSEKGNEKLRYEYYNDGKVKAEISLKNDSTRHGLTKTFYQSGKLASEVKYVDGKIVGDEVAYYESGVVQYRIPHTDGLQSGIATWYFENGDTSTLIPYYLDHPVGECYYYFPSGELKAYVVMDFDGIQRYQIEYNKDGQEIDHLGKGIVGLSHNGNDHFIGDTLKALFLLATPPKYNYEFKIYENMNNMDQVKLVKIDEEGSIFRYSKVLLNEGVFKWGGVYYISNGLKKDSSIFHGEIRVLKRN